MGQSWYTDFQIENVTLRLKKQKRRDHIPIYIYIFLFSIGHTFTRGLQKMKTTYENCQGRKKTSTKRQSEKNLKE